MLSYLWGVLSPCLTIGGSRLRLLKQLHYQLLVLPSARAGRGPS